MNAKIILTATILLTLALVAAGVPTIASAQYLGNVGAGGETGANTLEEMLKIKSDQVKLADEIKYGQIIPDRASPGMVMIVGALVGCVAAAFFIRGRSGKYAAARRG